MCGGRGSHICSTWSTKLGHSRLHSPMWNIQNKREHKTRIYFTLVPSRKSLPKPTAMPRKGIIRVHISNLSRRKRFWWRHCIWRIDHSRNSSQFHINQVLTCCLNHDLAVQVPDSEANVLPTVDGVVKRVAFNNYTDNSRQDIAPVGDDDVAVLPDWPPDWNSNTNRT
jgi:hypothetical protein